MEGGPVRRVRNIPLVLPPIHTLPLRVRGHHVPQVKVVREHNPAIPALVVKPRFHHPIHLRVILPLMVGMMDIMTTIDLSLEATCLYPFPCMYACMFVTVFSYGSRPSATICLDVRDRAIPLAATLGYLCYEYVHGAIRSCNIRAKVPFLCCHQLGIKLSIPLLNR